MSYITKLGKGLLVACIAIIGFSMLVQVASAQISDSKLQALKQVGLSQQQITLLLTILGSEQNPGNGGGGTSCLENNLVSGLVTSNSNTSKIQVVQQAVNQVTNNSLMTDGVYGPATVKGVKDLQKELDIVPDGIWGSTTAQAYTDWYEDNSPESCEINRTGKNHPGDPADLPITEPDPSEVSVKESFATKLIYEKGLSNEAYQAHCSNEGGTFNQCGTPCGPDESSCPEVCTPVCTGLSVPSDDKPDVPIRNIEGSTVNYKGSTEYTTEDYEAHCNYLSGTFDACGSDCPEDSEQCPTVCVMQCRGVQFDHED